MDFVLERGGFLKIRQTKFSTFTRFFKVMNITVLQIGKTNEEYISEAIHLFLGRLKFYNPVSWVEIPDLKERKNLSPLQIQEKEAELLLAKIPKVSFCVLLDERGKEFRSVEFADFIQKQLNSGIKDLVFLIGGAYGVSESMKQRANLTLALSKMTFTHQMIRILLAEQLYRALTILRNEPYHNE